MALSTFCCAVAAVNVPVEEIDGQDAQTYFLFKLNATVGRTAIAVSINGDSILGIGCIGTQPLVSKKSANQVRCFKGWNPTIKVPTLVVGSEHDTMDPVYMEWMAGQVQHGRYLYCPNGSHMSMWDDEVTYADGIVSFIKDVDSGIFPSVN